MKRSLVLLIGLALVATSCAMGTAIPDAPVTAVSSQGQAPRTSTAQAVSRWPLPTAVAQPSPTLSVDKHYLPGVRVSIFAGSGQRGRLDGPAREAQFDGPFALALDSHGTLYVAERGSGRIRVLDRDGFVRTWIGTAGEGESWVADASSPFSRPTGMTIGPDDEIYIVDASEQVAVVHARGVFYQKSADKAYASSLDEGAALGWDAVLDQDLNLYLSDAVHHRIRMLTTDGVLVTIAGTGEPGYVDGEGVLAQFNHPNGLAIDAQGRIYVADGGSMDPYESDANSCIRVISPSGGVSTLAGANRPGHVDGDAREAEFRHPLLGLDVDDLGNVWVADMNNHAIRMVSADGQVYTVAGSGTFGLHEGSGEACRLKLPVDVVWDGDKGLYVADYGANVIWHVALPGDLF